MAAYSWQALAFNGMIKPISLCMNFYIFCPLFIRDYLCGKVNSGIAFNRVHVLTCDSGKFPTIESIFPKIVKAMPKNSVAYETRRFNGAFTRTLIIHILCRFNQIPRIDTYLFKIHYNTKLHPIYTQTFLILPLLQVYLLKFTFLSSFNLPT